MTDEEMMKKIIKYNGVEKQSVIAMEELAELIQAISKVRRYGYHGVFKSNLDEEIADVAIILNELLIMYDMDIEEVLKIAIKKLNRELERMNND